METIVFLISVFLAGVLSFFLLVFFLFCQSMLGFYWMIKKVQKAFLCLGERFSGQA
ncbi:hypothetical protein SPAR28_0983 [Streptococcus pneumoniae GA13338]|nr:cytochrome c-type biogenesis protein [Streptococcus pneumoniae GA41301]EGJ19065.1 cytochrome c-type biogenesis protein [Streptococcus pneumoniae GA47901]EHD31268.1 cytochrome c-type biogenesis domain protein [Streptococcus pneumoniae GA11184]EHD51612.1 hypothetical protein SPAR40_1045 [Streptococcus pneumoniae GA16531]EHD53267.1 hypothetical protein SPAR128_1244 [Streptococcus pneumoniae 7286-06]EHD89815.1 hypothetical protein SPAR31_1000 [Streptococcus pneumoniae GA13494]EHD95814.1 cytoch